MAMAMGMGMGMETATGKPVEAPVEALAATTAEGGSPLTAELVWLNNKLEFTEPVTVALLFGEIQSSGDFYVYTFKIDDQTYVWGVDAPGPAPAPGATSTDILKTYALDTPETMTFDVWAIISKRVDLSTYTVDYGHGVRTIGIRYPEDIAKLMMGLQGEAMFDNVLQVSPWKPVVEIKSLKISVA